LPELCVFIPTRNRRELCEKTIQSFRETTLGDVDLYLVVDDDDDSYEGIDADVITVPRGTLVTAINDAAMQLADKYPMLFLAADDMIFETPGWDLFMTGMLQALGGTGYIYPDDKRRYDVPEHPLISSDIVKALGWFAEPGFGHFYIDNVWAELGKRLGLIRFCPQAVIEHRHYTLNADVARDETYSVAEDTHGRPDEAEYNEWRASRMQNQVSLLRRKFNPDIKWVLERF
jgi:glycosyltransferase involved in cell wall biosynthesis